MSGALASAEASCSRGVPEAALREGNVVHTEAMKASCSLGREESELQAVPPALARAGRRTGRRERDVETTSHQNGPGGWALLDAGDRGARRMERRDCGGPRRASVYSDAVRYRRDYAAMAAALWEGSG